MSPTAGTPSIEDDPLSRIVIGEGTVSLPSRGTILAAWLLGVLLLASVVGVGVHISELETLTDLIRRMRLRWLLVAGSLQGMTYVCAAAVWQVALAHEGRQTKLRDLVSVALAMLFANQAVPSAGVSGSLVVMRGLRRRGIPGPLVMGALVIGLVTMYAAHLLAIVIRLVLLRVRHAVSLPLLIVAGAFALATVGIPVGLIWYRESIAPRVRDRLLRVPLVGTFLESIGSAPSGLLHDRPLWRRAVAIQFGEIVLDAATLFVTLTAVGASIAPTAVFGCFVMACAIASVIPVPLGLGTFEGALVGMLRVVGVSIEAALTATLLLRGFTLWLPMLPGLWCARRELSRA